MVERLHNEAMERKERIEKRKQDLLATERNRIEANHIRANHHYARRAQRLARPAIEALAAMVARPHRRLSF
jgi:hypothetical protein